jgi:hypothetical protein
MQEAQEMEEDLQRREQLRQLQEQVPLDTIHLNSFPLTSCPSPVAPVPA